MFGKSRNFSLKVSDSHLTKDARSVIVIWVYFTVQVQYSLTDKQSAMHTIQPREIEVYELPNGQAPFTEWFTSIQDTKTQTRIRGRLDRLEKGNFGDYESVGSGIFELRLHFGPGYRIYFGEVDRTIVLLLCGGDKSTQTRDIQRAKTYWLEHKEEQQ